LPTSRPAAPPPRTSPLLVRTGRDEPTVKRFGKEDFAAFQRELYILWSTGQWPLLAALAREVEDPADYFSHFVRMAELAAHPGMRDFGFDLQGRQVFLDSADMLRLGFCLLAGVQGGPGPQAARLTGAQAKGVFAVWTSLYDTSLRCIGAAGEAPRCDFAEPRNKLKQCHEIAGLLGAPLLDGLSFAGEAWLAERQGDGARAASLRRRAEELVGQGMPWPPITRKAGRYETLTPMVNFQ
jgi:hypothetical protein